MKRFDRRKQRTNSSLPLSKVAQIRSQRIVKKVDGTLALLEARYGSRIALNVTVIDPSVKAVIVDRILV